MVFDCCTVLTNLSVRFFHNTAAVAAVFSVAGLIAVAIFFVCLTNSIRRRRAKQFDREIAEAAAAAANTKAPVFDDDVYGSGLTGYSDNSHGTYGQPPMTAESYGMTDLHPYDAFSANAGAAGVGVGAAVQRARSRKEMADSLPGMAMYDAGGMAPEHSSPYPAFSGPGAQRMYDAPHGGRYANPGHPAADLLEAAGIGAAGTHIRGPSLHSPQTSYSDQLQGNRNLHGPGISPQEQPPNESYATHYQLSSQPQNMGGSAHDTGGEDDAYGGYINSSHQSQLSPGVQLPNPHSPHAFFSPEESKSDDSDGQYENGEWQNESRASFRDEEDYELERGKRVLKVRSLFLFLQ
jgi:hypothetical protein